MKINVTADLSNMFTEDLDLSAIVKHEIMCLVKQQVFSAWKKDIRDVFSKAVIDEINKHRDEFIAATVDDLITNAKVKKSYSSDDMVSLSEWTIEELRRTQLSEKAVSNRLSAQTKEASDNISKELKDRYDILFASQIVAKLHENGMLKEDVAKLLLAGEEC